MERLRLWAFVLAVSYHMPCVRACLEAAFVAAHVFRRPFVLNFGMEWVLVVLELRQ